MRHLFVVDPLEDLLIEHDTSLAFMWEIQRRGGDIFTCQSRDISLDNGTVSFDTREVELNRSDPLIADQQQTRVSDRELDCIWIREDPPFDRNYLLTTYLLDQAGAPVINDPAGIRNWNEKLGTFLIDEWMPETIVTARAERIRNFLEKVAGKAVAKPLFGYGGEGLFLLDVTDPNYSPLIEMLTDQGNQRVMVQEYLPEVVEAGDRRLLVLGGEPLGSLRRQPREGDFRGNLHSGGTAHRDSVSDVDRRICEDLKPQLLEHGLHFVGVDMVGDRVLEVNVTSPTCLREINRETGQNLEQDVVDYVQNEVIENPGE